MVVKIIKEFNSELEISRSEYFLGRKAVFVHFNRGFDISEARDTQGKIAALTSEAKGRGEGSGEISLVRSQIG